MRYPFLWLGAVTLVTVAIAGDPPKLGPEWTYDPKMKQHTKTMPIKVVRSGSGQNYYLDLQHDKVLASDADNNSSTGVMINGSMSLEIRKNSRGGPPSVFYGVFNKYSYHDLDGDGVWDGWSDSRGDYRKRFIWRDGAWVQVCDTKAGFGDSPELSIDRKTEYMWDGKVWKSRSVDR